LIPQTGLVYDGIGIESFIIFGYANIMHSYQASTHSHNSYCLSDSYSCVSGKMAILIDEKVSEIVG
jgi:hypothetical protein